MHFDLVKYFDENEPTRTGKIASEISQVQTPLAFSTSFGQIHIQFSLPLTFLIRLLTSFRQAYIAKGENHSYLDFFSKRIDIFFL